MIHSRKIALYKKRLISVGIGLLLLAGVFATGESREYLTITSSYEFR